MSRLTQQVSDLISRHRPAPAVGVGAERRVEQRWIPEGVKTVTVMENVVATIQDESKGGACLRMAAETAIEMGQELKVDNNGKVRQGRVCWTTVDNFGSHRLVGLAWVK